MPFGASAFEGCSSLGEVSNSLHLRRSAQMPLRTVKNLKISNYRKRLHPLVLQAFMNCSALTMIRLPYELTTIEANTFSGCHRNGERCIFR
ncbi:MAG: leucine-rich repeat protein [Blautia massiliensis (ex Durand et al. 2017)]